MGARHDERGRWTWGDVQQGIRGQTRVDRGPRKRGGEHCGQADKAPREDLENTVRVATAWCEPLEVRKAPLGAWNLMGSLYLSRRIGWGEMVDTVEFVWMKKGFLWVLFCFILFLHTWEIVLWHRACFSHDLVAQTRFRLFLLRHYITLHNSNHFSYPLALHALKRSFLPSPSLLHSPIFSNPRNCLFFIMQISPRSTRSVF